MADGGETPFVWSVIPIKNKSLIMIIKYAILAFKYSIVKFNYGVLKFKYSIVIFKHAVLTFIYFIMQFWDSNIHYEVLTFIYFIMQFWDSNIHYEVLTFIYFIMQFWIKVQSRFWNMRIWLPLELVTELWYSDIQLRHSKLNSIFGFSFSILKWTYSFGRTLRDPFSKSNRVGLGITHQHNNLFPAKIVI